MVVENSQSDYQEIEFKKRARRRLVGSIALVLLMIVLLPMILVDKREDLPKQDLIITIPSEETIPAAPEAPAPIENQAATQTNPSDEAAANDEVSEKTVATDTTVTNVMVQVGVFADTANVKQIQSKLETNGFKVQSNAYANGKVRVRVGPYSSKAEADTAIAKLQSLKFNPMIVND
ncbi:MAG: SPOR domain-containing protein [Methylophilaceae bacterium]